MKKSSTVWIVVIIVIVVGAIIWMSSRGSSYAPGYGSGAAQQSAAPSGTTTQSVSPSGSPSGLLYTLNTSESPTLGAYLIATNNMALYINTKDTPGVSTCTGSCATAWPPYLVTTLDPLTGGNLVKGSISSIAGQGGKKQVTYNGMPLYFWQGDTKGGQTTGQGIGTFVVAKP